MFIIGYAVAIKIENRNIIITVKFDQEQWNYLYEYAIETCEDEDDYEAKDYFISEYTDHEIDFNLGKSGYMVKEIEKKYFSKGNAMIKFPFKIEFQTCFNPQSLSFDFISI